MKFMTPRIMMTLLGLLVVMFLLIEVVVFLQPSAAIPQTQAKAETEIWEEVESSEVGAYVWEDDNQPYEQPRHVYVDLFNPETNKKVSIAISNKDLVSMSMYELHLFGTLAALNTLPILDQETWWILGHKLIPARFLKGAVRD